VAPLCTRTPTRTRWQRTRPLCCEGLGHCRTCLLREQCQGYGTETKKPRRVSAVLWPLDEPPPEPAIPPALPPASHPILWGDWSRCRTRREWVDLLRTQRVDVCVQLAPQATLPSQLPISPALSALIGDSLGPSAWRAMPMPKPLPTFRSRYSGYRLFWPLSSTYRPSDGENGSSHAGRLQQSVALESGHVISHGLRNEFYLNSNLA